MLCQVIKTSRSPLVKSLKILSQVRRDCVDLFVKSQNTTFISRPMLNVKQQQLRNYCNELSLA